MKPLSEHYKEWIYRWETRLAERDKNRVVRPLDWGLEWSRDWPLENSRCPPSDREPENFITELNDAILARSDIFYSYQTPSDFRQDGDSLFFTSPVKTSVPNNNRVRARWFPAGRRGAVVVLPQWNADQESHNALCRIFNMVGISALRLSLPYHDVRKPAETERADYACSSNICRTLDAGRQAVADARSCLDWLESQGYSKLGILGSSLGSCYAYLASAHDERLKVNVFNHCSTTFAEVVWTGQATRHVRAGLDADLTLERLRRCWMAISPIAYAEKLARWPKKSLFIYARYDLTFLPEFSRRIIAESHRLHLDTKVAVLPCGHYTMGETPFKFLDAYCIASFLDRAFGEI
jgi:dienelactone hydrolase